MWSERLAPFVLLLALTACGDDFKEKVKAMPEGQTAVDPKTGIAITFHQKNAGSAGANGWILARSTGCGFQVLVPGPYNDFTQTMPTTDGATLRMHVLGMRTVEGGKFTVTCNERSDEKVPPHWKEDIVASFRKEHPGLQTRPAKLGSAEAIEFSVSTERSAAVFRIGSIGNRAYQLIVEYPPSEAGYMPELATSFFDSFRERASDSDASGQTRENAASQPPS